MLCLNNEITVFVYIHQNIFEIVYITISQNVSKSIVSQTNEQTDRRTDVVLLSISSIYRLKWYPKIRFNTSFLWIINFCKKCNFPF